MMNLPVQDQSVAKAPAGPNGSHASLLRGDLEMSAFDFRDLFAIFFRRRVGMAVIFGGSVLLGIALILLLPKIYDAKSSIQIDEQSSKVLGTEDAAPAASSYDAERFLQTQVDVLNSRSMARRVSDKLALTSSDDFFNKMHISKPMLDSSQQRTEAVLDSLQKNLKVEFPRESRLVLIHFRSRDPNLAAQIANTSGLFNADYIPL
jgi:uncharacterized protein involved in exopolysaccharide biosynthesis